MVRTRAPRGAAPPRVLGGFVSPHGLVVTNHHCAREGISAVTKPGETLLDSGIVYRWRTPSPGLDLGTPLDFVSTADTYGGNSGSPAVTKDLRIVGLNFDRNIDALVRDYIYLPERGRNVMVDVRAILGGAGQGVRGVPRGVRAPYRAARGE